MPLLVAILLLLAFVATAPAPNPPAFDLVVAGGRVIDPESGLDAVRHVGIKAGKIVMLSEVPLTGAPTLDAAGFVVAPGFIDLHSHVLTIPSMRMQEFDGFTTALELELGSLPIGQAYDLIARDGRPINYGFSVSWVLARMKVLDGVALKRRQNAWNRNCSSGSPSRKSTETPTRRTPPGCWAGDTNTGGSLRTHQAPPTASCTATHAMIQSRSSAAGGAATTA
jgi:hypothetical protein